MFERIAEKIEAILYLSVSIHICGDFNNSHKEWLVHLNIINEIEGKWLFSTYKQTQILDNPTYVPNVANFFYIAEAPILAFLKKLSYQNSFPHFQMDSFEHGKFNTIQKVSTKAK